MEDIIRLPPFLKLIFNEYCKHSPPYMEARSLNSMIITIERELAARRPNTSATLIDDEAKNTLELMELEGVETPVTEEDICVLLRDFTPGLLESCANEPAVLMHFDSSNDSDRPRFDCVSSNEHPDPAPAELFTEDLALETTESLAGRVETLESDNATLTRRLNARNEAEEQRMSELELRIQILEAERDDLKAKYQVTKNELQKKGKANSKLEEALASVEQDLVCTRAEHERIKKNELETKRRLKTLQLEYDANKNSINIIPAADGTLHLPNHNGYPCVHCKKNTQELRMAVERLENDLTIRTEDNRILQNTVDRLGEELDDLRMRIDDEDAARGDPSPGWSVTSTTLDMLETGTFFNNGESNDGVEKNLCNLLSSVPDLPQTNGILHRTMSTQAGAPVGCLMERRTGPDDPIPTKVSQDTANEETRRPKLVSTGTQCDTIARSGALALTDSAIHCDSFPSSFQPVTPPGMWNVREAAVQCDLAPSYFHLHAEETLVDSSTSEIDELFAGNDVQPLSSLLTDAAADTDLWPPRRQEVVSFPLKAKELGSSAKHPEKPTMSDVRTYPKPRRRGTQSGQSVLSDVQVYSGFLPSMESDADGTERDFERRAPDTLSTVNPPPLDIRPVNLDAISRIPERAMVDSGTNTPVSTTVDKFTITNRNMPIAKAKVQATVNHSLWWFWCLLLALVLVFWTVSEKECVDAPSALVESFPWETDVLPQLCYGRTAAVWKEGMYVVLNVLLGQAVMPT